MSSENYMSYAEGEEVRNPYGEGLGTIKKVDEDKGEYLVDFGELGEEWIKEIELI